MSDRPWLNNYDAGVPQTIDYPAIPLFDLLSQAAKKYPEAACTIFKGARITYQEMDLITDRLAAGLASIGIKKGDRVGIFMPNTPQFVMAYFAVLKLGAIVVAVNPLYTARELVHQTNDAGLEVMLVMSNFYNMVKEVQAETKIKTLVVSNIKETLPSILAFLFTLTKEKKDGFRIQLAESDYWMQDLINDHQPEQRPQVEVTPDDNALFQYSGGTTGISKAAIAMHRNLVANAIQIRSWMIEAKDGEETVLMALPLFHVYGMVAGMLFGIRTGAALVMVPNPRDLKDLLGNAQKYKTTIFHNSLIM